MKELEKVEPRPYGFIYITTNKINNKKYIGQKKFDNGSRWKSYLGSGFWLLKDIKKYGKENFKREIVDTSITEEGLNEKEYEWIDKYNAIGDKNFYNKIEGGNVQKSLKRKNSIPCICIDNNMVFRSIADASIWSGYTTLTIKNSFKKKHSFNKKEKLIFRLLSKVKGVKVKKKLCCVCGNNFTHKSNSQKFCNKCTSIKGKNKLIIDHDFEKSNNSGVRTYTLNDKWVREYIKEQPRRTSKTIESEVKSPTKTRIKKKIKKSKRNGHSPISYNAITDMEDNILKVFKYKYEAKDWINDNVISVKNAFSVARLIKLIRNGTDYNGYKFKLINKNKYNEFLSATKGRD